MKSSLDRPSLWHRAYEQLSADPTSGDDDSHPARPGEDGEADRPPKPWGSPLSARSFLGKFLTAE